MKFQESFRYNKNMYLESTVNYFLKENEVFLLVKTSLALIGSENPFN